jgi:hypothetical protein
MLQSTIIFYQRKSLLPFNKSGVIINVLGNGKNTPKNSPHSSYKPVNLPYNDENCS